MGEFPSGQRGQTVNLLLIASVVRIHPLPLLFFEKKYAGVAQLAEQLICNQQVVGSSPITSSFFILCVVNSLDLRLFYYIFDKLTVMHLKLI